MDMTDDGQFLLKVDIPDFDNLVQQRLVEAARIIEMDGYERDVDVWNALMVVIPYFSNPNQIKELADYQAPQEWINIVAQKY
jgi:hypothetical protein